MHSGITYSRSDLLAPRGLGQRLWDLAGVPFRFVLWPDAWNKKYGWSPLEEERLRAVLPQLQGRLLDVGAGTNTLVKLHGQGVGVDVFDFGGGAQIVEDTRHLPFVDGSFDTVTFIACLNHIPYRQEALQEAWRVLKPGGRIVATMINRFLGDIGHKIWWYGEDRERGGMVEGETGGLNVAEMRAIFTGAGFTDLQLSSFCYGLNGLYVAKKPIGQAAKRAA